MEKPLVHVRFVWRRLRHITKRLQCKGIPNLIHLRASQDVTRTTDLNKPLAFKEIHPTDGQPWTRDMTNVRDLPIGWIDFFKLVFREFFFSVHGGAFRLRANLTHYRGRTSAQAG